jgi:hypothetical protein
MSKKNIILGIILIVLVAFAWIYNGPFKNWQQSKNQEKNFLAGISAAEVSKVIINNNGKTAELDKSGSTWTIFGEKKFDVDSSAVTALNSILSEIGSSPIETISTNASNKNTFGTDDKGLKIEIVQAGKDFNFIAGHATPDSSGTYISEPNSNKTYQLALDLNSVFGRDDWRNLSLFSFIGERSEKVRFQYPNQQFTLQKTNNNWAGVLPKKFVVTNDKVNSLLDALSALKAAKIPAQTFAGTGLEKHSFILEASGEGFDNTLMVGDCTKDNLCYAKTAANDNIYLINKTDFIALAKKMTDLK